MTKHGKILDQSEQIDAVAALAGAEVVFNLPFGQWQGDQIGLLRRKVEGGRSEFAVLGLAFGSCSYCDSYEADYERFHYGSNDEQRLVMLEEQARELERMASLLTWRDNQSVLRLLLEDAGLYPWGRGAEAILEAMRNAPDVVSGLLFWPEGRDVEDVVVSVGEVFDAEVVYSGHFTVPLFDDIEACEPSGAEPGFAALLLKRDAEEVCRWSVWCSWCGDDDEISCSADRYEGVDEATARNIARTAAAISEADSWFTGRDLVRELRKFGLEMLLPEDVSNEMVELVRAREIEWGHPDPAEGV